MHHLVNAISISALNVHRCMCYLCVRSKCYFILTCLIIEVPIFPITHDISFTKEKVNCLYKHYKHQFKYSKHRNSHKREESKTNRGKNSAAFFSV